MLRMVVHTSAAAAAKYYTESLKREDYYSENQEIVGHWHGKAARLLGLSGRVRPEEFAALIENRHPLTGDQLTLRMRAGRRVGYDLNFHAPKSLSVLYELTQDKDVLAAFRKAVADTMQDLEQYTEARVRKKGAQTNRATGNLAWAEFVHFTARPVDGIPDPHLHAHCFTFNCTFDAVEKQWKAGEFAAIKREAHCAEAAFHARLAASLQELGYGIERKRKGWEIAGMPANVLAKFSRRTAEIERIAQEQGITDAKAKDSLGATTRKGKRHGLKFSDLLATWSVRLTEEEKVQISKVCYDRGFGGGPKVTAKEAIDYALAKHFERDSVVQRGHLLATALRFGVGHVSPEAIRAEFQKRQLIGKKIGDEHICTTIDVLAEEVLLLAFVREGRNSAMPLGGRGKPSASVKLSAEQMAAVTHLLTSRDQVIAIRGAAGVGKTTLMKEAAAQIEKQGLKLFAFAPSAAASRQTLREEGFSGADTVAHLLASEKLQKQVRGQVIWIDEAGLLGVRDLWQIMRIAGSSTRVILTGDAAQHAPVARGDAFRLLQKHAGLRIAEVTEIRRQQVQDYKLAVQALSKGDLRTGFRRLEGLGAFVEIAEDSARYRQLAADYLTLSKGGHIPLVVSPTHAESEQVTNAIREAKREAGQISCERKVKQYHNLQMDEADRKLAENYQEGQMAQFHQNAKGIKRGEQLRVIGRNEHGQVEVETSSGTRKVLPLSEARKFQVFEEKEIVLGKGDCIRITRNGESANGRRLSNGSTYTIEKFGRKGEIVLSNGAVLSAGHGHIAHGYCQTSHSSQSKSVKDVLIAQSEKSLVASSREQFYVSCSRGKETIRIYTDDRQSLQQAVGNSSTRMAGMELAGLTQKDISNFMSGALGDKQWRDAVRSRREGHDGKNFVGNLVEQRKTVIKSEIGGNLADWKGYVEMRRNMVGRDGKSRSKGLPVDPSKRRAVKGLTLPKTSQHRDSVREQIGKPVKQSAHKDKQADKVESPSKATKRKSAGLKGRLADAYKSAADHFQKLASKVKEKGQPQQGGREVNMGRTKVRPLQQGNSARAAAHAAKVKGAELKHAGGDHGKKMQVTQGKPPTRAPINKK